MEPVQDLPDGAVIHDGQEMPIAKAVAPDVGREHPDNGHEVRRPDEVVRLQLGFVLSHPFSPIKVLNEVLLVTGRDKLVSGHAGHIMAEASYGSPVTG